MNDVKSRIDWDSVRRRIKESEDALNRSLDDEQRLQATYANRALRLAARQESEAGAKRQATAVLVFKLAQEQFGIEVRRLSSVVRMKRCTALPGSPPGLVGVIGVRGQIRSVISLRQILAIGGHEEVAAGYVLLTNVNGCEVGLLVDEVDHVAEVAMDALVTTERGHEESPFIRGLAADGVRILNMERVLRHEVFAPDTGEMTGNQD